MGGGREVITSASYENMWLSAYDADTDAANVRLIASAPDLLETLKTVRDYVSDMAEGRIQQTPALTAMAHEDLARIDAAIARATGEAA